MTPVIALRYDASPAIGMGHLKRCMNLAAEMTRQGVDHLHLITRDTAVIVQAEGVLADRIRLIDDGQAAISDACSDVSHFLTDVCRAGHTEAATNEIGALTGLGAAVTVIDSMPPDHFTHAQGPAPDLVITPYLNAERYRDAPTAHHWVTGARYAVFGAEYTDLSVDDNAFDDRRVLVTCGGSDPEDRTISIVRRLLPSGLGVDVVIGPLFSSEQINALGDMAADHSSIILHHQPKSLAPLIAQSAYVVGRLGLTRYEAAAFGRSGLYLSAGTSYREYLEGFEAECLAKIFFDGDPTGTADFLDTVTGLNDPLRQSELFRPNIKARQLVNGQGAANVIEEVLKLTPRGRL